MKIFFLLFVGAALLAVVATWSFRPQRTQVIIRQTVVIVRVVSTPLQQANGLRGVTQLPTDQGMLFHFAGSPTTLIFTMQGMSIPLDFVWIREGRVIGFDENAPPDPWESQRRYSSPEPADQVLEVAAGTVARSGWQVGDPVWSVDRIP